MTFAADAPAATRTRSSAIDVIRLIGVGAVAIGHLWGSQPDDANLVRVLTYSWHVPIFFFLTGYLWSPGRPVRREASKRARSLLVPYFAWLTLVGLPLVLYVTWVDRFPAEDVGLTLWGGGLVRGLFAPYWFLPVLFFVAVLYRAMEQLPQQAVAGAAVAGLVSCYLWGEALSRLPLDIWFAVPCLAFVLAGRWLRTFEARIPAKVALALALGVASAVLLLSGVARPLDMKLGDFGTPILSVLVAIAICSALVVLLKAALRRPLPSRLGALVSELATTSVVILLTHTLVYRLLMEAGVGSYPAVAGITAAVTIAAALVIHRTPVSPLLAGVPPKPLRLQR